MIGGVIIIVMF